MWPRTRAGARPLAVHAGWRTDLDTAIQTICLASAGHRTPEPLRHARTLARTARARHSSQAEQPATDLPGRGGDSATNLFRARTYRR